MEGIYRLLAVVAGFGALGGLTNCLVAGELTLPRFELAGRVWRPGWIGNVVVGAVAALVASGIFGVASSIDVSTFFAPTSGGDAPLKLPPVPLGQVILSVLVGFSGGRYLTVLADKHLETVTRENLTAALQHLAAKQ